jgi:hypothetical protein
MASYDIILQDSFRGIAKLFIIKQVLQRKVSTIIHLAL